MRLSSSSIAAPSWRATTASVCPASRSASVSPTQRIGTRPCLSAAAAFCATSAIAFAVQRAPLRVADDDVAAAELGEHRRRDLAGVGARVVARAVLRAPVDRAAVQRVGDVVQVDRRNADRDLGVAERRRLQRGEQRFVAGGAAVHLPVADDERAALAAVARRASRSPRQHQLADVLVRLHERMRLGRFGGREDLMDHRLDDAGLEPAATRSCAAPRRSSP